MLSLVIVLSSCEQDIGHGAGRMWRSEGGISKGADSRADGEGRAGGGALDCEISHDR